MRALKYSLKGKTAFFKKPDVNSYCYFTYGNIHKVALTGLIGAILGLKGYDQQKIGDDYPEFYDKLQDIEIAIVPQAASDGYIPGVFGKKIQTFNNSTGSASTEAGGNLIVKEQWLENPCWDIYIKEGHRLYETIKERLLNRRYVYIPYLGKNDHFATIDQVCEVEIEKINETVKYQSLCIKEDFEMVVDDEDEDDYYEEKESFYKYEEKLPIGLEKEQNQYELTSFILTNKKLRIICEKDTYKTSDQKNIQFI